MEGHAWLRWSSQAAGAALILLMISDVFMTVLYARAGTGPMSHRMAGAAWAVVRRIGRCFPRRKALLLSFFGPLYVIGLTGLWMAMLLFGFTLLTWANLGTGIKSRSAQTPRDFATAFYFAGGTLTTAGAGDLAPAEPAFKFMTVMDALLGISILTLSLTYVIQIYTALQSRNALVLSMHHASGGSGDAAVLLAGLGPRDDFTHSDSQLAGVAAEATSVYESHHFYSVLIFFRFQEPHYALARGALVTLEMLAFVETALDDELHGWLKRSAAVTQLREAVMHMLSEFAGVYLPGGVPNVEHFPAHVTAHWRRRYHATIAYLRGRGISVAADPADGAERYVNLRSRWDPLIAAFAHYMEHPMSEIDPAGAQPAETGHHREMPVPELRA